MLFNSIQFFIFFSIVLSGYFFLQHKSQNRFLLIASYIFYGSWDYRFLSLLFISTVLDYFCAKQINRMPDAGQRKVFLGISIAANLTILGFFKYFNFFYETTQQLLQRMGLQTNPLILNIILPVGISFYTFQTMSYVIDVYRKTIKPAQSLLDFALYVSFFPQLVAGPIERASHLLPQIERPRHVTLNHFKEGLPLIFWGLFKKVVIADNLAVFVEAVFSTGHAPGYVGLFSTYAFALQIYGDFSGYSDIARGTAKMLGFDLMQNFNQPYLAMNPSDFWSRWHISLSTWLRDYLYIPLGGNRGGNLKTVRNLLLTMFLGGLWHGASWMFVLWGIYHGILLVLHRVATNLFKSPVRGLPSSLVWISKVIIMFHLTCFGWILFRAQTPQIAFNLIWHILFDFQMEQLGGLLAYSWFMTGVASLFVLGLFFYLYNYGNRVQERWNGFKSSWPMKGFAYGLIFALFILFAPMQAKQFIYFQF